MDKKKILMSGIVLLIGLMFTSCAWHYGDYPPPYYNLGLGFSYYGYPHYQGDEGREEYPVFDEHRHHHH